MFIEGHTSSDIFTVNGVEVHCVPYISKYNRVKIDLFTKTGYQQWVEYTNFTFYGMDIKVESARGAIQAKRAYLESAKPKDRAKHEADLKEIESNY